jgi:hypothetical protein
LYRISNKSTLASLLGVQRKDLIVMSDAPIYRTFDLDQNGKIRGIEDPNPRLKLLQARLNRLLTRIESPSFLNSGKKGLSFVDNAKAHQDGRYLIKVDIKSFYRSANREYIFRSFKNTFQMSDDLAWLITNLVTHNDFLPTGAPTSQQVAYWAYAATFNRLSLMADRVGADMSLYVDDLTFSSASPINRNIVKSIQEILAFVDLRLKEEKTQSYGGKEFKLVTGCAISPGNELCVANRHRKKIRAHMMGRDIHHLDRRDTDRLLGLLTSARQVDPNFYNDMYRRTRSHSSGLLSEEKKY